MTNKTGEELGLTIPNITLWQGDCLDLMKNIPDKSVDMVLSDPPYGTTACKWDVIIPFEPLWEQYKRIIKDNGCIALFGSEPFSSYLRMSNIKQYKYDWVWDKVNATGHLNVKARPLKQCELISIFSEGSATSTSLTMTYNPQGIFDVNFTKTNYETGTSGKRKCRKRGTAYKQIKSGYPKNILVFSYDKQKLHPTQKPVELLEYLIKTYTNENETVLDNCMGSGSTGVACINTNRNFIGIEKDEKYFEIAKNRIEDTKHKNKSLF